MAIPVQLRRRVLPVAKNDLASRILMRDSFTTEESSGNSFSLQALFDSEGPDAGRNNLILSLFLVLVSIALYLPSFSNGFVWDARIYILNDSTIRELKYLFSGFVEPLYKNVPLDGEQIKTLQYYRPFMKFLHVLEYQMFGARPYGYNGVNILANAAVVVLFFRVAATVTATRLTAFLAALLYAVNPTRVEAVSWNYSDSYIIVALFSLLSLLRYRAGNYRSALACYILALLTHETAILLPLVLAAHDYLVAGKRRPGDYSRLGWFLLASVIFLAVRTKVVGAIPLSGVEPATFANTAAVVMKRYVKIFFWPDAPVAIYPSQIFPAVTTEVAVGYVLLLCLAALALYLGMNDRKSLFCLLWFFIWSAVSLNVGSFGSYLMAEKLIYLASGGLSLLVVIGICRVIPARGIALSLILAAVAVHAGVTFSRLGYWRDTRTYLEKGLQHSPHFYLAHYTLAKNYVETGDNERALLEFRRTVEEHPRFSLAYNDMGILYYRKGDLEGAESAWRKAVETDPANPLPYFNLGLMMRKRGDLRSALAWMDLYLARAPQPDPRALQTILELRRPANGKEPGAQK
jgi:tetratricopeptide (TPR) repeat protein